MSIKLGGAIVAGGICASLAATMTDATQRRNVEIAYWVIAAVVVVLWEGRHFYTYRRGSQGVLPFVLVLAFAGTMTSLAAKEEDAQKRNGYMGAYWAITVVIGLGMWYYSYRKRGNIDWTRHHLEDFNRNYELGKYKENYKIFFEIVDELDKLTKSDDAAEWKLDQFLFKLVIISRDVSLNEHATKQDLLQMQYALTKIYLTVQQIFHGTFGFRKEVEKNMMDQVKKIEANLNRVTNFF